MIVRNRPSVWQLFTIFRLSVVRQIRTQLVSVAAFTALVVWIDSSHPAWFRTFSPTPFTLLGIALSIFLGFRNNACYERWWEARRQLGALIGVMRSTARLTLATPAGERTRREAAVLHQIAYTYALMAHLRDDLQPTQVPAYALSNNHNTPVRNQPDALLQQLSELYADMFRDGEFGEILYARFDDRVTEFAAIQVACERIKGTPVPFAYTLLLHRTAYAFCFLLPFGLASTFHYAAILLCTLVAYAFFGLDVLGDELQEPFSHGIHALPLSAMARTIEIGLLQALRRPELPESSQPVNCVLS